jgi:hypothetical protein
VLTPGDWANLRRELVVFHLDPIPYDRMTTPEAERVAARTLDELAANPKTFPYEPVPLPSSEAVRSVHDEFAGFITKLIEHGEIAIDQPAILARIVSRPIHGRSIFFFAKKGPFGKVTLPHLLGAFAQCLRECPEKEKCNGRRWFVAARLNQQYCGARCQSRATSRAGRVKDHENRLRRKSQGRMQAKRRKGGRRR